MTLDNIIIFPRDERYPQFSKETLLTRASTMRGDLKGMFDDLLASDRKRPRAELHDLTVSAISEQGMLAVAAELISRISHDELAAIAEAIITSDKMLTEIAVAGAAAIAGKRGRGSKQ